MLPADMAILDPLLCSAPPPIHPQVSKNLVLHSFPSSTNPLHRTLFWPVSVRCQKQPHPRDPRQAHKPAGPLGGSPRVHAGSQDLAFASAATCWTVSGTAIGEHDQTRLGELPGTSNASRQVHLFVIYTIVPRTPSVTLNPLSDVIEIF